MLKKSSDTREKIRQFLALTESEIDKILSNSKTSLFDKRILESIKEGSLKSLIDLLNQAYGKPQEKIEIKNTPPVALVEFKKAKN